MDLKTERLLSKFTVGVGHMMPDYEPPKRRFWIRLGGSVFFNGSLLFLASLSKCIPPLTFSVLFPIYLIFVLVGYRQLVAVESALSKGQVDNQLSQCSSSQAIDDLKRTAEYQSEKIMRKFELAMMLGSTALSISLFYGDMPQQARVLVVPFCFLACWIDWKTAKRLKLTSRSSS
ncbi:hypothetical protein BH11CYA1_BH11CYA1_27130 [soil metagenome]